MLSSFCSPSAFSFQGLPSHPVRIFGNNKIVVISGEFKPTGEEMSSALVQAVLEFGKVHRVKLILGVEGLPQQQQEGKNEPLQYVAVSKWFYEQMEKQKSTPITSGVVAGMSGLLLAEGSLSSFVDIGLLIAPTDVEKRFAPIPFLTWKFLAYIFLL